MRYNRSFGIIVSILFVVCFFLLPLNISALNPNHDGCSQCHSLHNAPGQALTDGLNSLCLTCHGPAGTSSLIVGNHANSTAKYDPFNMDCIKCHNPHDDIENSLGGTNIKQIGHRSGSATIDTPNSGTLAVVFESQAIGSHADGDSTYDGVCEVCHTETTYHQNTSAGNHSHYVGQTCTDCHKHNNDFAGEGGGCKGCHSSSQDNGDGLPTRRAIGDEFSLTSHHVMGGAVTDDDCGVCHYEFVDSSYHKDNKVDLRNPDDADVSAIISFQQFSRLTSNNVLESWVTDVQVNFCLKCHDSDGVTRIDFIGNALQPFSSNTRDAPNVQFQFSKASHHAVISVGDNEYCTQTAANGDQITMESPWNQNSDHDKISCFDCHGTSGHGSANQRMLRTSIDFDAMMIVGSFTNGASVETFCTSCHKSSVYVSASDPEAVGSIFEDHAGSQSKHGAGGGNELGCMGCHGGIANWSGGSDNGSARGNIHGTSENWGFPSELPDNFIVGGWLSEIIVNSSSGSCRGGVCAHSGGQGKSWTR